MKLDAISFTARGAKTAAKLRPELEALGIEMTCWTMKKDLPAHLGQPLETDLASWTKAVFGQADGLLFVGAAGIAVRAIAPHVKSKETDPAVVVVDELGINAISLLSGHIGGANELTRAIARILSARAVITTATDINGLFAVDQWAAERGLHISDMKLAKEVAARQLEGKKVGFYSGTPVRGDVPRGLILCDADGTALPETAGAESAAKNSDSIKAAGSDSAALQNETRQPPQEAHPSLGIVVTCRSDLRPFKDTLLLVPKCVTIGMGCRRDIASERVEELLEKTFLEGCIHPEALEKIASIDLKQAEKGLIAAAKKRGVPFETYASEALAEVKGEFSPSQFVRSVTGVDNVCERAAVLGSGGGKMILKKQAKEGVTAAAAVRDMELKF